MTSANPAGGTSFVPPELADTPQALERAVDAAAGLLKGRSVVFLTGAGCSTASGIPDYRGPLTRQTERSPIQYQAFIKSAETRRRYWSRAAVGWSRIQDAQPNAAHIALSRLAVVEGWAGLITQNVDGLHRRAGDPHGIELHGRLDQVVCLECGAYSSRTVLQERLVAANPTWFAVDRVIPPAPDELIAPDGDAEVEGDLSNFTVPTCVECAHGTLKPDVVFFGENVPRARVEKAYALVDSAEALVVAGSSLTVFSGYRFAKRAHSQDKPLLIVNRGTTRADPLATMLIDRRVDSFLPLLATALGA